MAANQAHQRLSGSPAPSVPAWPQRMHLYRECGVGTYLASARPLRQRAANLKPEFDGKAVPAVICHAFVSQYGGEIRRKLSEGSDQSLSTEIGWNQADWSIAAVQPARPDA